MVAPAVRISGHLPGPICSQQHTRQQTCSLSFICLLASREKCVNLTPFRFLPKQNSPSRCLCFESWEAQVNVCTHLGCLITNSDYKWLTALPQQPSSCSPGPGQLCVNIRTSAANRLIGEVVQSRRRPLLGPSPGWKRLLALSHLRHY